MKAITVRFLVALLFSSSQVHAEGHWNINFDPNGDDRLGQQLASELRHKLATSPRYGFRTGVEDSMFSLKMVTIDPFGGRQNPQSATVYSCVLLISDPRNPEMWHYVSQFVGICPSEAMAKCVSTIYSAMDASFTPIAQGLDQRMNKALKPSPPQPASKEPKTPM
ncbi:MAG: hypothetical protein WBX11_09480 [Thiobacillaceae bacterium]